MFAVDYTRLKAVGAIKNTVSVSVHLPERVGPASEQSIAEFSGGDVAVQIPIKCQEFGIAHHLIALSEVGPANVGNLIGVIDKNSRVEIKKFEH